MNLEMLFKNMNFYFLFYIYTLFMFYTSIEGKGTQVVTCGSVIKLINIDLKIRLHSHDVKYGTGSGQQSVTGTEAREDVNSHWLIKNQTGLGCRRGEPIKCGSQIRLEHLATAKNLHSHRFQSPLTGNQEVSAYGDDKGEGDTGDHWVVLCDGVSWRRDTEVILRHVDTDMYLAATTRTYGRPIHGQSEIVGVNSLNSGSTRWQTLEGLFVHPSTFDPTQNIQHNSHDEL